MLLYQHLDLSRSEGKNIESESVCKYATNLFHTINGENDFLNIDDVEVLGGYSIKISRCISKSLVSCTKKVQPRVSLLERTHFIASHSLSKSQWTLEPMY
jgi:hypothetical protein